MSIKSETRTARLDLRLTRQHKRLIERAALATGRPVTSFVLSSVLDCARATLELEARTVLSDRVREGFLEMLASGERPAPALVRAVERSRKREH